MSSRTVAVRGAQRPRVELRPTAAYTDLGDDAVELCRAVGLRLDDWQAHVVRGMLGERLDGRFAASRVGVVVPRQQGKGVILEARALAGLFLLGERYIIWTAHELKTAQTAFLRLRSWIDGSPDLAKHVRQMYTGNTENSIVLNDGRTLRFLARTAGSGRGLTADCLILDEAYALKDQEVAALLPTLTTSENPQTIYTSSAGMPNSEVLAGLREQGMDEKSKGLAYFEWSAPDDADPDDMDALIQANPGLGVRLSLEHVASERASMDDEVFKRERLGIWAQAGHDGIITAKDWNACADADLVRALTDEGLQVDQGLRGVRIGVDVSPDRSRASVAVAGVRRDGRLWVEVIDRGAGPEWLVPAITPIWQRRAAGSPLLIAGGSAAGDLARDFRRAGARVRLLSQQDYASACGRFVDGVRGGHVRHLSQVELNEAVAAAAPSSKGGRLFTWKRSDVSKDITPLVAVTLAASQLWRDLLDGVVAPAGGASDSDGPGQVRARVRRSRPRVLRERKGVRERATYD